MCLEVKTKQKRIQCSVFTYIASKLKSMWGHVSMWPCHPRKRRIVIQNGRQNEVAVITYVMVPVVTGYKENKTCRGGKKGGVAIINSEFFWLVDFSFIADTGVAIIKIDTSLLVLFF